MSASPNPTFMCSICGTAVDLRMCKTDERGQSVHGQCYAAELAVPHPPVMKMKAAARQKTKIPPAVSRDTEQRKSSPSYSIEARFKYPDWQKPYQAALLETEHSRLKQKILDAEAAIDKRRLELTHDGHVDGCAQETAVTFLETLAIGDAIATLKILRSEL